MKLSHKIKRTMIEKIESLLQDYREILINLIMESYDLNLNGVVRDAESTLKPELYQEEFLNRLSNFDFVTQDRNKFSLRIPDMEEFNFDDGLEIIQLIIEGIPEKVSEISGSDYIKFTGKRHYTGSYYRGVVSRNRHYLLRFKEAEKILEKSGKEAKLYPFSLQPPIDIFESAREFLTSSAPNINQELKSYLKKKL